jgi:hypothetical protein
MLPMALACGYNVSLLSAWWREKADKPYIKACVRGCNDTASAEDVFVCAGYVYLYLIM